jgi:hypothetical protein
MDEKEANAAISGYPKPSLTPRSHSQTAVRRWNESVPDLKCVSAGSATRETQHPQGRLLLRPQLIPGRFGGNVC